MVTQEDGLDKLVGTGGTKKWSESESVLKSIGLADSLYGRDKPRCRCGLGLGGFDMRYVRKKNSWFSVLTSLIPF